MSRHRRAAAIASLLGAALAAAGCGLGPGPGVGRVSLTVTRDYGAERVLPRVVEDASESDTVMRVLDRNAEISTRYGGGFVEAVDGLSEAQRGGDRFDWFFYVNGVESPVGAADFSLRGGEAIWWDYRDWSAAEGVPAVVGSWPEPFADGYEGQPHPVELRCEGGGTACGEVRRRLRAAGAEVGGRGSDDPIRVLVGPWRRLRHDPAAAQVDRGPRASGVFADFARRGDGYRLRGLDEGGEPRHDFGPAAGLVAATRRYESPPVWLVTGVGSAGVRAAAGLLAAGRLRDHYAVATEAGEDTPLPLRRP